MSFNFKIKYKNRVQMYLLKLSDLGIFLVSFIMPFNVIKKSNYFQVTVIRLVIDGE